MKVVIVSDPRIPVPPRLYGGIERIVDLLIQGLQERGHEVTLFAHADSEVPCRHVPYGGTDAQSVVDTLRNALTISRLVYHRPDIIHSFGRLAYLAPLLPLRIPKIMSYQRRPTPSRIRTAMMLARENSLAFTGCSDHITEEIRPYAPVRTVYNGVPLDTYTFQGTVPQNAPLVFLGRIAPIKGTHTAVEVARRSGRRLIIAGNVPEDQQSFFRKEIEPNLDGEQIRYLGPVSDEEKNELLGSAAALLMPIEWEEPFGIVMAEAMACGTPVIGKRRGAVPEVVEEGETGFIGNTIGELVGAVEQVDTLDRASTRGRCEKMFSGQAVVEGYESLYEEMSLGLQANTV